jgi:alpha-amylase
LSKIALVKKQAIEKPKNLSMLRTVLFEKGFHFYRELGKYSGITVNGMVEFADKLQVVPIESVMFHLKRQDFQKWFKNTIGDAELVKRIDQINAEFQNEDLRKALIKTVQNRIVELQCSSQNISS